MKKANKLKRSSRLLVESWQRKFTKLPVKLLVILKRDSDCNYVEGTDKSRQIEKLQVKQPHIVIGTPGRIYDLVASGDLAIHKAHTFV